MTNTAAARRAIRRSSRRSRTIVSRARTIVNRARTIVSRAAATARATARANARANARAAATTTLVRRGNSESSESSKSSKSSDASSQDPSYKCVSPSDDDDDDDDDDDNDYDQSSKLKYDFPPHKNEYEYLINMVSAIFTLIHDNIYYITEPTIQKNTYIFRIKLRAQPESAPHVSSVVIHIMDEEVNSSGTKSGNPVLTGVFNIASVSTDVNHSRKHLAILLLIYAISYLQFILFKYEPIEYAILDDCSNQSTDMTNNIYHQLGFVPRDHTSVDLPGSQESEPSRIVLECGPEKIARLVDFPQKALAKLNNIIKKYEIADSALMPAIRLLGRELMRAEYIRRHNPRRRNPRQDDPRQDDPREDDPREDDRTRERDGGKKFTKKSYKRKSYKRKSYKRK